MEETREASAKRRFPEFLRQHAGGVLIVTLVLGSIGTGVACFLDENPNNARQIALLSLVLLAGVHWSAWLFGLGRFASPSAARREETGSRQATASQGATTRSAATPLRFVVAKLFVEIINDFRHLLALVMVSLFAIILFVAMWPGLRSGDIDSVKDGVQAVAAALGGLIGSIIGYYFGESAAMAKSSAGAQGPPTDSASDSAVQGEASQAATQAEGVSKVPRPKGLDVRRKPSEAGDGRPTDDTSDPARSEPPQQDPPGEDSK